MGGRGVSRTGRHFRKLLLDVCRGNLHKELAGNFGEPLAVVEKRVPIRSREVGLER